MSDIKLYQLASIIETNETTCRIVTCQDETLFEGEFEEIEWSEVSSEILHSKIVSMSIRTDERSGLSSLEICVEPSMEDGDEDSDEYIGDSDYNYRY